MKKKSNLKVNKIVGFLIAQEKRVLEIDFFNVGLNFEIIQHNEFYIHLWGIGDLTKCRFTNSYSLSFPLTDSLLDRNLIIELTESSIIIKNDWLGSIPLFYNSETSVVSTIAQFCKSNSKLNFKEVINFCEVGYSILGNTIIDNVKFMEFNSTLELSESEVKVNSKFDFALKDLMSDEFENEKSVLINISKYLNDSIMDFDGDIIVPTSGGLDSRLILSLINPGNKAQLSCYTYGVNKKQKNSFEVVYASEICKKLGLYWRQIKLKDIYDWIPQWYKIFGFSTHLHGMYQIDFYKGILNNKHHQNPILISGIVGDAWAGSINYSDFGIPEFKKMAYSHNLCLDRRFFTKKIARGNDNYEIEDSNLERYCKNDRLKVLYTIRTKMLLLSYLMTLPEYFGIPALSPFLNYNVVKSMLLISPERRRNRKWQRDYFKSVGLDIENMNLNFSKINTIGVDLVEGHLFEKLSSEFLNDFFDPKKVENINKTLLNPSIVDKFLAKSEKVPIWRRLLKIIGIENPIKRALIDYSILKPIEIQLNGKS